MKKVSIEQKKYILEDIFNVEEVLLRYEKFNGEMSNTVRRISLERGDSVAVLIFNLNTNKIIFVNQFRYSSYTSGNGWLTELIAGIVNPNETPEETAYREVQEETGLQISTMEHVSSFYLSPGGSSERIHLYYSEVSGESAKYKPTGGLLVEDENINVEEFSLGDALNMIKTGEIMDAKTIIGILWLEKRQLQKSDK